MRSNFPRTAVLDDNEWDRVSCYSLVSHNTGFSKGTSGVRPDGRLLNFEVDEYLIRHTIARGNKTPLEGGLWRFALGEVVVVTRGDMPDLEVQDANFVAGFMPASEQNNAKQKYQVLLEQLETALDEEDMLNALEEQLSNHHDLTIPLLIQCPPDCPLLQHCAKQGWAAAVRWLLNHGFQAGLGYRCKHRMTLLHFVAWEGRQNVMEELGDAARDLCDIPNAFGELPELSGFIRSRQLALEDQEAQGDQETLARSCLEVAVACRRLRTGRGSAQDFVEDANVQIISSSSLSEVLLPIGVEQQAIDQHFVGPTYCTDFVSRYVHMPPVLPRVLNVLAVNHNLERLVLEYCGIGRESLPALIHFLSNLEQRLAFLWLSGNLLGDDAVQQLLPKLHGKVVSLNLSGTGITAESLGAIGDLVRNGEVEKLNIGANDLAELGSAAQCVHMRTLAMKMSESQTLKSMDLSKTRLTPGQLTHLAEMIRRAPALDTLVLVSVSLTMEFAALDAENPFIRSMQDPMCKVLRLETSLLEYPELFRAFMGAKRKRGKGQGKGYGKTGKNSSKHSRDGSSRQPQRSDRADGRVDTLCLPVCLLVRLKGIRQVHPDRPMVASFSTERYGISADLELDRESVAPDLQQRGTHVLEAYLQSRNKETATLHVLGGSVSNQPGYLACTRLKEASNAFVALDSICLVFYRRSTNDILLVPEWSAASKLLRSRMDDFLLDDSYVLQDRFGIGRKSLRRLSANEIMQDIDIGDFSADELYLLANLTDFENYKTWVGQEVFSVRHSVDFQRLQRHPVVLELMDQFKGIVREKGISRPTRTALHLPSDPHVAIRVAGKDHERQVDLQASIRTCVFKWFTSMVSCREMSPESVECLSHDGRWKRILFLVSISEDMVDHSGEVKGLRQSSAEWVPVSQLHQELQESRFPISGSITTLLGRNPSHQLLWQPSADQAHLKVKFQRK